MISTMLCHPSEIDLSITRLQTVLKDAVVWSFVVDELKPHGVQEWES